MLGSLVMIATRLRAFRGSGMAMTALMASLLSGVVFVVFGAGTGYLTLLGRNATLTERTFLWSDLLSLTSNKLVGSGFENFWAGWRLERIWGVHLWHPNQAHNGYLEVYLNLGWVGILLTVLIILFAWRAVVGNVRRGSEVDRLWLTLFLVALVYNVTEAALFRMQAPVSIFLLMAVIGGMHGWRVVNERATATNLPDRAAPRFSRPVATAWRQKPGGLGAATLRGERAE
jgi:O-antigen ligase